MVSRKWYGDGIRPLHAAVWRKWWIHVSSPRHTDTGVTASTIDKWINKTYGNDRGSMQFLRCFCVGHFFMSTKIAQRLVRKNSYSMNFRILLRCHTLASLNKNRSTREDLRILKPFIPYPHPFKKLQI